MSHIIIIFRRMVDVPIPTLPYMLAVVTVVGSM